MNTSTLRLALIVSLLFNFGVLGALGWQQLVDLASTESADPLLVRELQLNDEQRQRWQAIEEPFLIELNLSTVAIQQDRNRLIESIFTERLDKQHINAAQTSLAAQQNHQQQLVIDQLLREREILDEHQRERLAQLLTQQSAPLSDVEMLHGE